MRNYVCWGDDAVHSIINPDADAVPDHVFRAVHTDFPVLKRNQYQADGQYIQPEDVLRDFLKPKDFALVPVVGESGTGKSHLIRWLQVRLGESAEREVIFVPKAGTNLRGIVASLIERLPEKAREPYSAALKGTGSTVLNSPAQRAAVLNQLHVQLMNDPGTAQEREEQEEEEFLLQGLRNLFLDPYVRDQHLARDKGFAAEIAAHVFQKPDRYEAAEQRREFGQSDLPLSVTSLSKGSHATREFLPALLGNPKWIAKSVDIINRNVDAAIANCLNVTGDRLIELMSDIRRHIKKDGKELVLLIEDFARLQGLDRALLQSLLEQKDDLCRLRTAFATTTGFFDSIASTVRTRLSFVIALDVPLSEHGGVPLPRVVARYLNALRWGPKSLRAQLDQDGLRERSFAVESKCGECEHKTGCHQAFGQIDGMGLYPFTAEAIQIMADRADSEAHQHFNLRTFQRRVLRPILEEGKMLRGGHFPPPNLLDSLGGVKHFPTAEDNKLQKLDPAGYKRRLTLLQLWKDASSVVDLDENVLAAFGMRPLGIPEVVGAGVGGTKQRPEPPTGAKPKPPKEPVHTKSEAQLEELDQWHREQGQLSSSTAQDLRESVFEALNGFIDWDSVGLAPGSFSGGNRAFMAKSIFFVNQVTQKTASHVSLSVPADWSDTHERYETVMALQGLVELREHQSWNFEHAAEKAAALHNRLLAWSQSVVDQLRHLDAAGCDWDPAATAFELRAMAVALTSPGLHLQADVDVLRAALGDIGAVPDLLTEPLSALIADLSKHGDNLKRAITSRYSEMKGGEPGAYLDGAALLDVASAFLKRGMHPSEELPREQDLRTDELRTLWKLAKRVVAELPDLLKAELKARATWISEMKSAFGSATKAEVVQATTSLLDAIGTLAISGTTELVSANNEFSTSSYDEAITSAKHDVTDLAQVALGLSACIRSSRRLALALKRTLEIAERELVGRLKTQGIDPETAESTNATIKHSLQSISESLAEITRVHSA